MEVQLTVIIAVAAVIIGGALVGWFATMYNGIIHVRQEARKAFANIDVLLLQRHDEIPNLVAAVKGYMKHEKELLEEIVKLRSDYRRTEHRWEKVAIENRISGALGRIRLVAEDYPDLKASESFLTLQRRVSALEGNIAYRREYYDESVTIYNTRIAQFPQLIVARTLGFKPQPLLYVPSKYKEDVETDI